MICYPRVPRYDECDSSTRGQSQASWRCKATKVLRKLSIYGRRSPDVGLEVN